MIKMKKEYVLPAAGGAAVGTGVWAYNDPVISSNAGRLTSNLSNILKSANDTNDYTKGYTNAKIALNAAKENVRNWAVSPNADKDYGDYAKGVDVQFNYLPESVTHKIDNIIEKGIQDYISRNPVKSAVGIGALGAGTAYGLTTGKLQKATNYVGGHSPKEMYSAAKDTISKKLDTVGDKSISDLAHSAKDGLGNIISSITEGEITSAGSNSGPAGTTSKSASENGPQGGLADIVTNKVKNEINPIPQADSKPQLDGPSLQTGVKDNTGFLDFNMKPTAKNPTTNDLLTQNKTSNQLLARMASK